MRRVSHPSLRPITIRGRSAHLGHHMHKTGRKTSTFYIYRISTMTQFVRIVIIGSQRNIIFQDISRTKLPFSKTNYTRFKGKKSKYVQKAYNVVFFLL